MPALLPENTSPDLRGSSLAPKEPYHVPGYTGYRPQFKYQCSETFGQSTNRLLTCPSVRKSSNSVLRPIDPPRSQTVPVGFHDVPKMEDDDYDIAQILESRRHKWGDKLYKPEMRSGYMGFVPKAHFSSYHSRTFPDICNSALKDFSEDQALHNQKINDLHRTIRMQEGEHLIGPDRKMISISSPLPLRAIRSSLPPYMSPSAFKIHESPYFLPDHHPQKHFKSGFAGHVPFYKDLGGHGFPIVTKHALREFSRERDRIFSTTDKEMDPRSVAEPRPPRKSVSFPSQTARQRIFLIESGIKPKYAGYVPGQKFRFGQTFGHSTENPLQLKRTTPNPVTVLI